MVVQSTLPELTEDPDFNPLSVENLPKDFQVKCDWVIQKCKKQKSNRQSEVNNFNFTVLTSELIFTAQELDLGMIVVL